MSAADRAPTFATLVRAPDWHAAVGSWADAVTDGTHLLVVSYDRNAAAYAETLRDATTGEPASFVVIEVGVEDSDPIPAGVDVRSESPDRITGIGLQTNEFLTRWRDADGTPLVVFDSVSTLLETVPLDVTYRFLHPFIGQVRHAGGRGFYHFTDDHDPAAIATLEQLFDRFVSVEAGNEPSFARSSTSP